MYQQILVPTDGSEMSARAVETAARLAKLTEAKLEVLSVKEPFPYSAISEMQPVPPAKFGEKVRGTDITYDDLSMRFLYWPSARIVRQEKHKGRDCILLSIRNPDGAGAYSSVDVWIDKLSGGMLKMIGNDHGGRPIRRFEVLSGKKFGDIWMVDEMRIETVTGAAGGTVKSSTRMQIQSVAE